MQYSEQWLTINQVSSVKLSVYSMTKHTTGFSSYATSIDGHVAVILADWFNLAVACPDRHRLGVSSSVVIHPEGLALIVWCGLCIVLIAHLYLSTSTQPLLLQLRLAHANQTLHLGCHTKSTFAFKEGNSMWCLAVRGFCGQDTQMMMALDVQLATELCGGEVSNAE